MVKQWYYFRKVDEWLILRLELMESSMHVASRLSKQRKRTVLYVPSPMHWINTTTKKVVAFYWKKTFIPNHKWKFFFSNEVFQEMSGILIPDMKNLINMTCFVRFLSIRTFGNFKHFCVVVRSIFELHSFKKHSIIKKMLAYCPIENKK